jgi:Ca2+-binding EF-hand superfamily protein
METIQEFIKDDEKIIQLTKIIFEQLDDDLSGEISREELEKKLWGEENSESKEGPLKNISIPIENKEKVLEILDSNNSGSIDFFELKELIREMLGRYIKSVS